MTMRYNQVGIEDVNMNTNYEQILIEYSIQYTNLYRTNKISFHLKKKLVCIEMVHLFRTSF